MLVVGAGRRTFPLWKAGQVDNYLVCRGLRPGAAGAVRGPHAAALGMERMYGRALNAMPVEDGSLVSVGSEVVEGTPSSWPPARAHGTKYPGEAEHLGMGVSYCATCDGMVPTEDGMWSWWASRPRRPEEADNTSTAWAARSPMWPKPGRIPWTRPFPSAVASSWRS